jgi:hypothetical protein
LQPFQLTSIVAAPIESDPAIKPFFSGSDAARGPAIIVRYADDIVVGFEQETDARRFWDAMRDRLQGFSLSLHPKKTRLIEFGRHAANNRKQRGLGKPETFNFLGMSELDDERLEDAAFIEEREDTDVTGDIEIEDSN